MRRAPSPKFDRTDRNGRDHEPRVENDPEQCRPAFRRYTDRGECRQMQAHRLKDLAANDRPSPRQLNDERRRKRPR
jgi:hypothetical protein